MPNTKSPPDALTINANIHIDAGLSQQILDAVNALAKQLTAQATGLLRREDQAIVLLSDLEAKVARQTTVDASVIELLNNITEMLRGVGTDPSRLQAVIDTLTNEQARIIAAVAANTPT